MIVILGLIILIAAVITGVAGVFRNGGSGHALTHGFSVFGYHVTGSAGTLFLYGIVVGAVALAGLSLLLAGARRTSRRGRAARHGLRQSRQETAAISQDRDDLIGQRDTARAYTASDLGNGTPRSDPHPGTGESRSGGWRRLSGRRAAPRQAPAEPAEPLTGQPAGPKSRKRYLLAACTNHSPPAIAAWMRWCRTPPTRRDGDIRSSSHSRLVTALVSCSATSRRRLSVAYWSQRWTPSNSRSRLSHGVFGSARWARWCLGKHHRSFVQNWFSDGTDAACPCWSATSWT